MDLVIDNFSMLKDNVSYPLVDVKFNDGYSLRVCSPYCMLYAALYRGDRLEALFVPGITTSYPQNNVRISGFSSRGIISQQDMHAYLSKAQDYADHGFDNTSHDSLGWHVYNVLENCLMPHIGFALWSGKYGILSDVPDFIKKDLGL